MFRYPRVSGTRDLVDPNCQTAQPALDFPVGQTFERDAFLQSHQPFTTRGANRVVEANIPFARRRRRSFGPPSGPGARPAIGPTALVGFLPFAGLLPMPSGATSPPCRACMLFAEALAAIDFRRGIVRPKEL